MGSGLKYEVEAFDFGLDLGFADSDHDPDLEMLVGVT